MISIIVPAFNEVDNVEVLCGRLCTVMSRLNEFYEVIFVEGGSTDGTYEKLLSLKKRYDFLKIIKLKKRYGQAIGLAVGIRHSSGEIILTMDSDLQHDPEDIPRFLEAMKNGYDMVYGWRKVRQSPFSPTVIISRIGNKVLSQLSGIKINDFSSTFKSYTQDAANKIGSKLYPGYHRFIPVIGSKLGLRFCVVETRDKKRLYGRSKYGLLKIFKAMYDYLTIVACHRQLKDFPTNELLQSIEHSIE